MDTRRNPGSRQPDRPAPVPAIDTAPVKLVELQRVGGKGGPSLSFTLIAVGLVAILAFAFGASISARPGPSPSTDAAIASPGTSPAVSAGATTRPTVRPTAEPSAPPRWAWTRVELAPGEHVNPQGIWSIDDRAFILSYKDAPDGRSSLTLARLEQPGSWQAEPPPGAIQGLSGGSVIDRRLWFLAEVRGVSESDLTYQLVSTQDGLSWDSLGASRGLGPPPGLEYGGAEFVRRFGDLWIASVVVYSYNEERDEYKRERWQPLWSRDGVRWTEGTSPNLGTQGSLLYADSIGDTLVVVGTDWNEEAAQSFVLTSTDGRVWKRATSYELPPNVFPSGLACNADRCVVTGVSDPAVPNAPAAVSVDGRHWDSIAIKLPADEVGQGPIGLASTDTGFIALGQQTGYALLSEDGTSWRALEVLPRSLDTYLLGLVVAGDVVLGVEGYSEEGGVGVWRGRLSSMAER